jgi:ribosomal protein L17
MEQIPDSQIQEISETPKPEETKMEEEIETTTKVSKNKEKSIVEKMLSTATQDKLEKIREKFTQNLPTKTENKPVIYLILKVS